jgi:hypothetical protein
MDRVILGFRIRLGYIDSFVIPMFYRAGVERIPCGTPTPSPDRENGPG